MKFGSVFEEPPELPPCRGVFDHTIQLDLGSGPVNIWPYTEMRDRGIIQNRSSPFASLVVLVGKKDDTWRLCIDYRELNKRTVKNKFTISIIDELINELSRRSCLASYI